MEIPDQPVLLGRSSSHFTRLARIVLDECGVGYQFAPVADLLSTDAAVYGEHPALKLPALRTASGTLYGSLNIADFGARTGRDVPHIIWPHELADDLSRNAQEIVTQAMATQVIVVLAKVSKISVENLFHAKARASLANSVKWLDGRLDAILAGLPNRDFSLMEISLYCLIRHLEFRQTLSLDNAVHLVDWAGRMEARTSWGETAYRFDRFD